MQFSLVLSLLFAIVVALFAVQNSASVPVAFLAWETTISVALVILGAAFLGALIVGLLGFVKQLGLGLRLRNLQSRINKLEGEIAQLAAEKAQLEERLAVQEKGEQKEHGV
ncbi:MAG: LapA family protein [Limnochordia bacterium]|jgi:putative membrane protein